MINLDVTYRDAIDRSEALEDRLRNKLSKIDKKLSKPSNYKAVFERNGINYKVQLSFQALRQDIVAEAQADDAYKAVDQAADRAERQVRKLHDKIASH